MNLQQIVEDLSKRATFKQDLVFWLSLEAFQDIEGWRRCDTGDIGYSYPKWAQPADEDEAEAQEELPYLLLSKDDYTWTWEILHNGRRDLPTKGGYKLAGVAAEAGLAAYNEHLATSS